jgi:hypothetical protein
LSWEGAVLPSLAWAAMSKLSNLTAVVEGVRRVGTCIVTLAGCGDELPLMAAGCEIEDERRFSRLIERDCEDEVPLI